MILYIQRWQCPTYNSTVKTLIWSKMLRITSFFSLEKCCFSKTPLFLRNKNAEVTFPEKPQTKKNSLKKQKHGYLFHTWSDKAFKGTVVNRTLPSLHGGSLEITLTGLQYWIFWSFFQGTKSLKSGPLFFLYIKFFNLNKNNYFIISKLDIFWEITVVHNLK